MPVCDRMIAFPAHALLIVEERLKEHQADGTLDPAADVTELALKSTSPLRNPSPILPRPAIHTAEMRVCHCVGSV